MKIFILAFGVSLVISAVPLGAQTNNALTNVDWQAMKQSRPFTVYYLVDTGEVGLSTDLGYGKGTMALPIRYSPGPPYYISTARF